MPQEPKIKRLFFDCETAPDVAYTWRVGPKIFLDYENIIEERSLISIAYKWEHEKDIKALWWKGLGKDKHMLEKFVPILEEADEIVAHYGDRFDLPWIRARAAFHGIPVSPYIKSIDTKAQSSRLFYFNSNRLDYLAQFLGVGKKMETDFDLWKDVMAGSATALARMIRYNKHDVRLLEKVYKKLEGYNKPKTHVAVLNGGNKEDCPYCGSDRTHRRGYRVTALGTRTRSMQCIGCGRWFQAPLRKGEDND
jgi:DNA polymerase elongation subunit (family B)